MKNILYQVFFIVMLCSSNLFLNCMDQTIKEKIKKLKRVEREEIIEHQKECRLCKQFLLCSDEYKISEKFDKQRKELRLASGPKDQ